MTLKEHGELLDLFSQEIKKIYPSFQVGITNTSSTDETVISSQLQFSFFQKSFIGTRYHYEDHKQFIHYTTLESLYAILNSGAIRMSDLNNMNDPFEFNYAIKKNNLPVDNKQIEFFKKSLFITSLCAYEDSAKDSFNMWRLYGNSGKGVALVFDLVNPQDNFYEFLLCKVIYGTDNNEFKRLESAIHIIDEFVTNKGLIIDNFPQLIGALLMLHKNNIWEEEKEYRLFSFLKNDNFYLKNNYNFLISGNSNIGHKLILDGKTSSYLEYPLIGKLTSKGKLIFKKDEDLTTYLSRLPQFRISKIITGYSISNSFFEELKLYVYKMSQNLGGYISVEKSQFSEWF